MFCLVSKVSKIKYKEIKAFIGIIGITSYVITAVLYFSAAAIKLNFSIKDKVQYETVVVKVKIW